MAYSELANWDGSLSSTKPTLPSKSKNAQQLPASGSSSHAQATNYASGTSKGGRLSSYNGPTRGEPSRKGEDVVTELRETATRPPTVNAVAHGLGNDQSLLDSGCVPYQDSTQSDKAAADPQNTGTHHAANGDIGSTSRKHTDSGDAQLSKNPTSKLLVERVEIDPPTPTIPLVVSPESIQNPPTMNSIAKPISSSSNKEKGGEGATTSSQSSNSTFRRTSEIDTSTPFPQASKSVPTIEKSPRITQQSSISRDIHHSQPTVSTPSLQREESTPISRKKRKLDGVYLPPLAITRDFYMPLSSYFPLAHPISSEAGSSNPGTRPVPPVASKNSPNVARDKASEPMADKRGETAEVAVISALVNGMSASTPIVVDYSSDQPPQIGTALVSAHEKGGPASSQISSVTRKPDLSPITDILKRHAEISEATIVTDISKWVALDVPCRAAKTEDGDSIHVPSQRKQSTLSTSSSKAKVASKTTSGRGRSRMQDDVFEDGEGDISFDDDPEETCHQCRQRNKYAKMKCCRIKNDDVCPSSYCHRCILLRYPNIDFNPDAANFVCPKCLEVCVCFACCSAQGRTYVQIKNSRKLLNGVSLLLSHAETRRLQEIEKVIQAPNNVDNLAVEKKRKPRNSRVNVKPYIGEEAEAWLRIREGRKSSGRTFRRSFVGEWSKAWGTQPSRIREMECAFSKAFPTSQSMVVTDKPESPKQSQCYYIGEPVHQLLRRFREKDRSSTNNTTHRVIAPPQAAVPLSDVYGGETIKVVRAIPKPKRTEPRRSTLKMPEFTINHRESEASTSSSSSVMRLVTPADSVFNYKAYREDGHDDPMLGSVNQNDGLDGLNLDLNTSSLDGIHSDPFSFTNSYNTFSRQMLSGSWQKTNEGQSHALGISTDEATLLGGTISELDYSAQLPSDAFIYGTPSYSGLTKEELERVARMALASITNPTI